MKTGFFYAKVKPLDKRNWDDDTPVTLLFCVGGQYDEATNTFVCGDESRPNDDVYGGFDPQDFHVGFANDQYLILEIPEELK